MTGKNEYANRIRIARDLLGMRQREFGAPVDLSERNMTDLEIGRKKLTPELAVLFEKVHKIDMRWLLTGEGEMFIKEKEDSQGITAKAENYSITNVNGTVNVPVNIPASASGLTCGGSELLRLYNLFDVKQRVALLNKAFEIESEMQNNKE